MFAEQSDVRKFYLLCALVAGAVVPVNYKAQSVAHY